MCKAKAAYGAVLGKNDASLANRALTATEAPDLDTKSLVAKLDDVAKTVDLDASTMLAEEYEDSVLATARSWIRKRFSREPQAPEIQISK